jgi:hypothetical protein
MNAFQLELHLTEQCGEKPVCLWRHSDGLEGTTRLFRSTTIRLSEAVWIGSLIKTAL